MIYYSFSFKCYFIFNQKPIFAGTFINNRLQKFLLFFFLAPFWGFSQALPHDQSNYFLKAYRTTEEITLDGESREEIWQRAVAIGDFWQKFPTADTLSAAKTIVKAAFDDKFLYFFIEAFDTTDNYLAPSLKRDGSLLNQDGVAVLLDPVNKKTNGFGFACTPNNVQSEYQYGNSFGDLSYAWDNKWFSATKKLDDRYVVEMAIPFKTLRYKFENTSWGINIFRSVKNANSFSTWTKIPVQFNAVDLGYFGTLQFDGELIKQKSNVSIIPYITGSMASVNQNVSRERVADFEGVNPSYKANAGFDAKIAVTASMNLDVTVNPDFSQVEVDEQVTNLTRFSILFPERRTFFLENSDIFSDFGSPAYKPFFSRTIGLDKDAHPIPILYGVRLSGNLTEKTRIGLMNMETLEKGDYLGQNFTAASVLRKIGARSVVKGYFLNRDVINKNGEHNLSELDKYGRNAGLEINLTNVTGVNHLWAGYHTSIKAGITEDNNFAQMGVAHFGRLYQGYAEYYDFGKSYYTDMGLINRIETFAQVGKYYTDPDTVIRAGFRQLNMANNFHFRPKDLDVVHMVFGLRNNMVWFENGELSDQKHTFFGTLNFRNTAKFNLDFNIHEDNLRYYFPLPEDRPLPPDNYKYNNMAVNFSGDTRKKLILNAGVLFGRFYNAQIRQYNLSMLLRKQPVLSVTLNAQFNDLYFPQNYGRTKLWLIGPKVEATFTNKLFWTTFLQFNTQRNNFNINSRIQYRYSPMSDFFLVYSDNYFTDTFQNKNRAIVFKFNYWLSL